MKRQSVTVEDFVPPPAMVNEKPRGAPPPAPPGDFCLAKSHQKRFAPEGSPADTAGSSRLGSASGGAHTGYPYPGCARAASLLRPVGLDFGLSSTLARLRGWRGNGVKTKDGVGPRMARPSTARRWASAPKGAKTGGLRRACRERDLASGRAGNPTPRSAGKPRHPGVLSLGNFSLHEQREVTRERGGSPLLQTAAEGGSINPSCAA